MCTYLKNMEGYKLNDLKLKDFDSIQEMFDRAFKRVNTFEDFRTELVEGKEKRAGTELIQEITKKQKVEDDKETAEIKKLMEIIPDEEEVAIDAIPLAVKFPSIVDKKIYKEGRKSYYQIRRADGKSQMYMFFSQMPKIFDRGDLEDLYKLETDIRQKDEKQSKNGQNQARNGKAWKSQSQIKAKAKKFKVKVNPEADFIDFENYVKANDAVLRNMQNQGQGLQNQMTNLTEMLSKFITSNTASSSDSGTLPSQTVTNPREHVNAITTRSVKTCEGPSTPLVPAPVVSIPSKEPEQNPETSMDKVQKPSLESTAQVPPPEEEDSIFIEIPKPKAKKTVNNEIQDLNSPRPNSYKSKLPYPERMKVRENDKPSTQHSRFLKMFKQLRLEIGLKDALIEMPKFNEWLSSLLRNKEKLKEIAITTVNAKCSAINMNKVPEKLKDLGKFLIPCALQELDRTSALADSGASINLLPHSICKQLGLGGFTPTRMTLELANHSVTHPMGIAQDVVVRVDGFTFLADFVVVNFEPDPRVSIILGRPFLHTAKALIDLYEEKLTLRVGSDELVFYAEKSEKSKNKQFAHAISVIDFLKDEPFSGSTTNHSDALPPSSSPVKTSDNLEEFADELTLLKKDVHFQVYSNPLFEFDDNFTSSNVNPLFNEMDEDVVNENSNVSDSDEPVLLNTPLSDKVECFAPEDDIDEIDAFLAMEVSSNFEEGYFDSEGDVTFLENLLSDDTTHNLAPEVISDHEPEQNESSITFSPRSDPLHHEFAGELLTLPSRNDREFEEYLSLMTVLCEISTSRSQENVHANQSSIIESLPVSPIPVEDSEPVQEEIDIFLVPDDLIPPGVENDDSEDEDNELPNLDHQDNPSSPRPPPEPPDVCLDFKPNTAMNDEDFNRGEIVLSLNVEDVNSFTFVIWTFLPFFTYSEDSPFILSLRNEDLVFDPGISTFHFSFKPVPFALPKDK
ncbi:reverse transcriptase domain-containing protein [Tanacetum coccineum]